jgi:hypothetical protein
VVPFIQAAYALQREDVQVQADFVQKAFRAQHYFMRVVTSCKRPSGKPQVYCDFSLIFSSKVSALDEWSWDKTLNPKTLLQGISQTCLREGKKTRKKILFTKF